MDHIQDPQEEAAAISKEQVEILALKELLHESQKNLYESQDQVRIFTQELRKVQEQLKDKQAKFIAMEATAIRYRTSSEQNSFALDIMLSLFKETVAAQLEQICKPKD